MSRLSGIAALVVAAFLTLPVPSFPLTAGGEFEYQAAMTVAFQQHLHWGSQIVWSYGPFGYMNVLDFMDSHTWALALAANLAAHAILFAVLGLFLVRIGARRWHWLLVAALIIVFFDRYRGFEFERFPVLDHKAAIVAVLLLYLAAEASSKPVAALLAGGAGMVVGYLILDKGTFLLVGIGLLVVFGVLSLARGRLESIAAGLAGTLASCLGLWLLAGQPIAGLAAYLRSSYEIIAGYTAAMSWFSGAAHPRLQLGVALAMLAATGALIVLTLRRGVPLFTLLVLMSPLMFFAFKNSFIRFDEAHAVTFWSLLGVLEGLVVVHAIVSSNGGTRRVPVMVAGVIALACAVLVGGLAAAIGRTPELAARLPFPDNLLSYRHAAALLATPERRAQEETQVRDGLRAAYPLPSALVDLLRQGRVDVVPWDIQLVFAYGLDWDPQPVLLSYSAYRPYLDHIDAQHYLGPDAPKFVLLVPQDIDGRYPLFSEPETYRVLLDRYQVRERISSLLVLERRPASSIPVENRVGTVKGQIGEWMTVPAHGEQRLFGRVHVGYTVIGEALTLIDRPPELHIRIRYGDGQVSPAYRFVPAVASDGLDLSSYAPDAAGVEDLAKGLFGQPVEAIQIVADAPSAAYQRQVTVTYFTN